MLLDEEIKFEIKRIRIYEKTGFFSFITLSLHL